MTLHLRSLATAVPGAALGPEQAASHLSEFSALGESVACIQPLQPNQQP